MKTLRDLDTDRNADGHDDGEVNNLLVIEESERSNRDRLSPVFVCLSFVVCGETGKRGYGLNIVHTRVTN